MENDHLLKQLAISVFWFSSVPTERKFLIYLIPVLLAYDFYLMTYQKAVVIISLLSVLTVIFVTQ